LTSISASKGATPARGRRLTLSLLTALAVIAVGALQLSQRDSAMAAVDPASVTVTPSVVISPGEATVTVTFTNAAPVTVDSFVAVAGSGVTIANPVVECQVGAEPCTPGDETCDAALLAEFADEIFCAQFAANQTTNGNEPYTVTLTFDLTCEGDDPARIAVGDWNGTAVTNSVGRFVVCVVPGAQPGVFVVTKDFDGDPAQDFGYTLTTDATSCQASIAGGPLETFAPGGNFSLAGGESAVFACFLVGATPGTDWTLTVTEADPGSEVATLTAIDCGETDATADLPMRSASLTVTLVDAQIISGSGACTFVNDAPGVDDPGAPNVSATKVCVGEGFDATFEVTVAGVTEEAACGDTVTAFDLDPGTYDVSETISGGDAEAFVTVIVCSDGSVTEGTSASVTLPAEGATDIACVIINSFDSLAGLLCPCGALDLEIDIDNTNNNGIGIDNANTNNNANDNDNDNLNANDNENKNDNQNENTQDQTNTQDQDNANDQTNNITSSPEVNIDFD
jgi:hypothetical protein